MSSLNGIVLKHYRICLAQVLSLPLLPYMCVYMKSHHGFVIICEIIIYLEFENNHTDVAISGKVSSVKFGPDAKYIAVGSMDRNLRIFGLPGEDGETES